MSRIICQEYMRVQLMKSKDLENVLNGTIKAMEEGDICNYKEVDKAIKRDKMLDFLLKERKWWEFWKAK